MPTVKSSMQGKICLVTGANSRIGKATALALALAQRGATVVMVCRDSARGEQARSEITTTSRNNAVDLLQADLSSQQSIQQLVENFQQHYPHLHVLINNAGATFPGRRRETVDGVEMTFAVNYLAPFLLTHLLLDRPQASAPARIVNVSSAAHKSGSIQLDDLQAEKRYRSMRTYPQAKLSMVLFTYELARRLQGTGVTANCINASVPMRLCREKDAIMTRAALIVEAALTPEGLLAWMIVGLIAGLLTGFVMRVEGYRWIGDILVDTIGAFLGGWLANFLGLVGLYGLIGGIVLASLGACVLIAILHAVTHGANRQ